MVSTNATVNYSMALRKFLEEYTTSHFKVGRRSHTGTRLVRQYVPLKRAYVTAQLHGITTHNILNLMSLF
jgi:hypothetical protein